MYALYLFFTACCLLLCCPSPAYANMVASPADAAIAGPWGLEPDEYEAQGITAPEVIITLGDSPAPLSLSASDLVNCVCYRVRLSGVEYTLLLPSVYESSLMVDSDGYLWNMSGSSVTGRLFEDSFDPSADTGLLLTLSPCLGNNFSVNHNYGSPNYMRSYYWNYNDRLSYDDTYVLVEVLDTFHLFHSGDLLHYVIVFLVACCLICLWKRSGR